MDLLVKRILSASVAENVDTNGGYTLVVEPPTNETAVLQEVEVSADADVLVRFGFGTRTGGTRMAPCRHMRPGPADHETMFYVEPTVVENANETDLRRGYVDQTTITWLLTDKNLVLEPGECFWVFIQAGTTTANVTTTIQVAEGHAGTAN